MIFRLPLLFVSLSFVSLIFVALSASPATADEYRHWTTTKGVRSTVRLKMVSREGDQIKLQREDNGKISSMKLMGLSSGDRRFIRDAQSKSIADSRSSPAPPSDWTQWRGPLREGKSGAAGLMKQWPSGGPELVWSIEGLGEGYATPAVVDGVVYVMGSRGGDSYLFALSSEDGSQRWASRIGSKTAGGGFAGPKGTPTVDGELMYVLGGEGSLVCFRRTDGSEVWRKDLVNDFGGEVGHWRYAESPLIDGDKLICAPGGTNAAVVALSKSNGTPIWRSQIANDGSATAGYASLIAANLLGTRQYIAFLHGGVFGIDARNGAPLWDYRSPANGTANCSTPVALGNSVFAASAYGTGGGRATISRQGARWNAREDYFVPTMESHHGGFILHDGYIYGTNNSVLMCLDWNNGEIQWRNRCVGKGSVSMADGHLYVRGEGGDVALVEVTPNEYREKGRFSQPNRSGKSAWAHPVVAGKSLYLHDQDRLLRYRLAE